MQINLTGQHIEVSDSLKDYVNTKFARLARHDEQATSAHVVLTIEKQRQKAEASIHVPRGTLHAIAEEADMYAAIDLLADKLDRQLKRHKEKLKDHRPETGTKGM